VGLPEGNGVIPVTVGSTTRYRVGDRIVLDPEQTNQDTLLVERIVSGTVMNCNSESNVPTHTHASGAIIQLSIAVIDVILQAPNGNAAAVWIGSDDTVTVAGGSAFYELPATTAPAQPAEFRQSQSGGYNIARTSDGWMIGTAADKVGVAAEVL
jgi:hypothetical protein